MSGLILQNSKSQIPKGQKHEKLISESQLNWVVVCIHENKFNNLGNIPSKSNKSNYLICPQPAKIRTPWSLGYSASSSKGEFKNPQQITPTEHGLKRKQDNGISNKLPTKAFHLLTCSC